MIKKEKVFDDIARVAGGTVSVMSGVTKQIKEEVRTRIDELAQRMDLVPREDFDRLEFMVQDLTKKVAALEKPIATKKKATAEKPKPKAKAAPKKKTAPKATKT